jgi:hypothetical protein
MASAARQIVSLPCPLPVDRGDLAAESSRSPSSPYLWRRGELVGSSVRRRLFQGRSPESLAGARQVVPVLLHECQCVATFVILVRNRDRTGMAMVQEDR